SLNEADLVLPVYILDPDIFRIASGGWPKTGAFRANFLQETLRDLNKQLNGRNASLSFYIGKAQEIIPNLVKQHQIDQVLSVKEHTPEEIAAEIAVSKALFPIQLKLVEDRMLILPEQLPFAPGHLPEVFTE
ncbi:deoxyribodipyrimidine photo-lyase, partial [Arthrospira platensis SPKY1]|nr:deoxyribodipyrimidine photo-lyase [Arthrospira platensis SPKY1]